MPAHSAAILGADDSRGHGCVQAKRTANRQHPIANLDTIGIPELCHWQFLGWLDLNHRQIGFFIHADDFRVVFGGFAVQLHLNFGGLIHDVIVGENESLAVHDHAGTETALRGCGSIRPSIKKTVEKVLHGIIRIVGLLIVRLLLTALGGGPTPLHHLRRRDIHHRRLDTIHNGRERIRRRNGVRHGQGSRTLAGKRDALHCGGMAGNNGSDENSYHQRERHKQAGNHFFPTRPAEHLGNWFTHFCCSCILSAVRPLARMEPYHLEYNTANLRKFSRANSAPENTLALWPGRLWRFADLISSLSLTQQPAKLLSSNVAL